MYGVAPYHEITPERTPELVQAVRATLKRRGEGGPGWSRAWKTVLYARMNDAPQALHNLRTLFGTQVMGGLMQLEANWGGAYGKLKRTLAVRYGEKRVDVHLEPGQTIRLSATLEQGIRD